MPRRSLFLLFVLIALLAGNACVERSKSRHVSGPRIPHGRIVTLSPAGSTVTTTKL